MKFRPCIDLHQGVVKQIVGSTLSDNGDIPETNFEAEKPAKRAKHHKRTTITINFMVLPFGSFSKGRSKN